ncbi:hypothetical protein ACL9RI_17190 [Janthinobacterium sp. Mn2066]|uniref:hypothetical protein n=1 Tax=Janthinobacterium sp. Mn2066 TaxID=3395264 RepID=UPI003BBFD9B4
MAEPIHHMLTHQELTELLIKHYDINEGFWAIAIEFRMGATLAGPNEKERIPSAMVGIGGIGIQSAGAESPIAVDAAKINPSPNASPKKPSKPRKTSG